MPCGQRQGVAGADVPVLVVRPVEGAEADARYVVGHAQVQPAGEGGAGG